MPVIVVATIKPKPEHHDEVLAAFQAAAGKVHAEDGCELYALHQRDDRLVMIERWSSAEALAVHGASSPALQELNPLLKGKLREPTEVITLDPVPAGDSGKGRL